MTINYIAYLIGCLIIILPLILVNIWANEVYNSLYFPFMYLIFLIILVEWSGKRKERASRSEKSKKN